MKFYNFLIEASNNTHKKNLKIDYYDMIQLIAKNCKPFLKEINYSLPIYRGISVASDDELFLEIKTRKDRKPLDTKQEVHEFFDELFLKTFDWKARSEGVFCTPLIPTANRYGDLYLFFPIGNYEYLWSSKITDLYLYSHADSKYYKKYKNWLSISNILTNERYKDLIEKTKKEVEKTIKSYKTNDIQKNDDSEIIFKCDKYYLMKIEYDYMSDKVVKSDSFARTVVHNILSDLRKANV